MAGRFWKLLMNEGNGLTVTYDVYRRMHVRN